MTEHTAGEKKVLVLINYEPEDRGTSIELLPGWQLGQTLPLGNCIATQKGTIIDLQMAHNSGISLILKKV